MNFENKTGFTVNSSHQSFKDKQKSLFDELDKVKMTLPEQMSIDDEIDDNLKDCHQTKTYKGMKSIFKRPEAPLRKCLPPRRTPDYKINPHKWTKYSLSDVKDEDMSDRANKSAALSFLKDLEKRNEVNFAFTDKETRGTVVKFNKSALIDIPKEAETKTMFECSKVIMPEYVIGQRIKKDKKNRKKLSGHVPKLLTLNHLIEDDEDRIE